MQQRTPRPDILSVPPNSNYYDGLREAESKFPIHPGNSIVGVADSISSANNNGLDSAKQNYRPSSSSSTKGVNSQRPNSRPNRNFINTDVEPNEDQENKVNLDSLTGAASQAPGRSFQPTPDDENLPQSGIISNVPPPNLDLSPPLPRVTTTTEPSSFEDYDIDVRMRDSNKDPVYNFIKRFDPNSPDSHKTAMSKSEIISLNQHLPAGQVSAEDERTPRRNKNVGNNINKVDSGSKGITGIKRFDTVNIKPVNPTDTFIEPNGKSNSASVPNTELLPPKSDFSDQPSTTMGPPIYYEWKWAVPAFDLEPPKENNTTNTTETPQVKKVTGKRPFSDATRPTPKDVDPIPSNTEYNISSYFVPDYVFPLDKPHPGYEHEDAQTSFQVQVARPGRASYGENPACPQCHPAYLEPGSCEPCIVKR